MILHRRRTNDFLVPQTPADPKWVPLGKLVGGIAGTIPEHPEMAWQEGVATRLDWADRRLWVLLEPRIWFVGVTEENRAVAADFGRERIVRRYNRPLNDLISFWTDILSNGGKELRALHVSSGVDAVFKLGTATAFSWRARG